MSALTILAWIAIVLFLAAAFIWSRFEDRFGGVSLGWLGVALLTFGVFILK